MQQCKVYTGQVDTVILYPLYPCKDCSGITALYLIAVCGRDNFKICYQLIHSLERS